MEITQIKFLGGGPSILWNRDFDFIDVLAEPDLVTLWLGNSIALLRPD